jgi:hypothetical protein
VACVVAGLLATGLVAVARHALGRGPGAGWSTTSVPAGWQLVSSRGLQVAVPADWPVNANTGCGPRAPFSITRDPGLVLDCEVSPGRPVTEVTIQPASAYAERDDALKGRPTSSQQVSLAGAPAILFRGSYPDGRAALVLTVPALDAQVAATGPDVALLARVLQTTRVVEVDDVGCARDLPFRPAWDVPRPGPAIRPGSPTSVDVCLYEGTVLGASKTLTGSQVAAVVAAMTAARPGPVPDPRSCLAGVSEPSPMWLQLRYADGSEQDVRVRFSGCRARWMASPTGVSQVSVALLRATLGPLRTNLPFGSDLPKR